MAWVRLDDQFPDHPKVVQAGPLAAWLHVCALAYCNRYLTDGHIPAAQVVKLADFTGVAAVAATNGEESGLATVGSDVDCEKLAEQLVSAGIWHRVKGGFAIHDYLEYQPSRTKMEATQQHRAEAGRKGGKTRSRDPTEANRKQSAKQNPSKTEANGQAKAQAKSKPVPEPVGLKNSSSKTFSAEHTYEEEEESVDDQEKQTKLAGAARLLAASDLETRNVRMPGQPIDNEPRWLDVAARRRLESHGPQLAALAEQNPQWTPEQLADALRNARENARNPNSFRRDSARGNEPANVYDYTPPECPHCNGKGVHETDNGTYTDCECKYENRTQRSDKPIGIEQW